MTLLYDFAFFMFALFSIPKFLIRLNQANNSKQLIGQRFGFFDPDLKNKFLGKKVVWLHAVSVGEVNAAREWIKLFLNEYPEWIIALSTTTPTGQTIAESLVTPSPISSPPERGRGKGEGVDRIVVFYAPLDLSFVVQRVLNFVQPKIVLLMETEIWPNLIIHAHKGRIPIGIINGRISPHSFERYRLISSWMRSILNKLSFCFVQSEREQNYFQKLGMMPEKIISTGNMKFDVNGYSIEDGSIYQNRTVLKGLNSDSLILIGGSTHWDEEKKLLSVFKRLRGIFPKLKLILAPRHPERLPQVQTVIQEFNFHCCLYSDLERRSASYEVLLINQMGVLASLYSIADVVFMGGSLVKHGGQNPIEAAGFKKPILHGPNVINFQEVYRILDGQNAAIQIISEDELFQQSKKLLEHPELRMEMGARAWASIQSMKGATARTLAHLSGWISQSLSSVATA